jgi:hypothetical protein
MKPLRRLIPDAMFVIAIGLLAWPLVAPIQGATAAVPDAVVKANLVRLRMASPDSISPTSFTKLLNAMYDAPASSIISNSRLGSGLARQRMVTALADGQLSGGDERFIMSGSPFTDAEKADLTKANATLIRAPAHAAHNAILATKDLGTTRVIPGQDPADPAPETEPGPPLALDGPHPAVKASMMKLPWSVLGSQFFELSTAASWSNPELLTTWGLTRNATDKKWRLPGSDFYYDTFGGQVPMFTARYEPSAANLYLLTALSKVAPDQWKAYVAQTNVKGPSESFLGGHVNTIRSRGVGSLLQYLDDQTTATKNLFTGTMGPAPLWAVAQLQETYPNFNQALWVSELQNGSKEWVAPTSESVTKAIAAGGDTPLYALDHDAPGGYPLAWIDSMYVPATGLSIDEVNAVSAFIRFVATDGQDIVKADNDGVIGPDLVTKAFAAANAAVTSNCDAAKGVARLEADSPYYPLAAVAPKLHALAPQMVCATPVDPSTTTTTSTSTTSTSTTSTSTTSTSTTSTTQATTTTTAASTTTQATTTTIGATTTTRASTTVRATTTPTTRATPSTTQPAVVLAATNQPTPASTVATTTPRTTTTLPSDQVVGAPLAPSVAALPLGLPSTGRAGFDRWTTMFLGGGVCFRVLRRIFRKAAA